MIEKIRGMGNFRGQSWTTCAIVLLCFSSQMQFVGSFIVPQELPSILSLVYSNIPPLKKGTDSRLGFGFRLGEHADFQMVVELGPQKETKPLGDQDSDSSFNKREVNGIDKEAELNIKQNQKTIGSENDWIENWAKQNNIEKKLKKKQLIRKKPSEFYNVKMISEQSLKQLVSLYKMADSNNPSQASAKVAPIVNNTSTDLKKHDNITMELMNVSLDDEI